MSEDRELLELAAKAAGMKILPEGRWPDPVGGWFYNAHGGGSGGLFYYGGRNNAFNRWNPLTDDGDALRLAVKIGLEVFTKDEPFDTAAVSRYGMDDIYSEHRADDPYAATRRAIVRAAAQIGKAMP